LIGDFLLINLAATSRRYLLGRNCSNWNQGNGKGNKQPCGKTPPISHLKNVMGKSWFINEFGSD
jgi:hypothetical protein